MIPGKPPPLLLLGGRSEADGWIRVMGHKERSNRHRGERERKQVAEERLRDSEVGSTCCT